MGLGKTLQIITLIDMLIK
jgi:SNF2 family DNA or RNA helicase